MVAFVELVLTEHLKNAWITIQARGVQMYFFPNIANPTEPLIRLFEGYSSDNAVDFIPE